MKTKDLTRIAMMSAVIAVLSPISIPLAGEVPVSLATFAVMLAGCALGAKGGAASAAIYLALGAIGAPVFAGYRSGLAVLTGVTGGFLFGYIPLAFICGAVYRTFGRDAHGTGKVLWMTAGMLAGNLVLYAFGVIWFMTVTQYPMSAAMTACVIPFIPGDIAKMVLVNAVIPGVERVLK